MTMSMSFSFNIVYYLYNHLTDPNTRQFATHRIMFGEEDEEEDDSDNKDFFMELTAMQEQMNREGDTPTTELDEGEGTSNYPLNTAMPPSINILRTLSEGAKAFVSHPLLRYCLSKGPFLSCSQQFACAWSTRYSTDYGRRKFF